MRIDKKTKLFIGLTYEQAVTLQKFSEKIILSGDIPYPLPEYFHDWMKEFGYNDNQAPLMLSTVFTQYALLSVARYYSETFGD